MSFIAFYCHVSRADEPTQSANTFDSTQIQAFLKQNCHRCHGRKKQEADFRLDNMDFTFATRRQLHKWTAVVDRINLGEMPPKEEPRPDLQQQNQFVDWIAANIRQAKTQNAQNGMVLRRLNRRQYENTIRDLVGIDLLPAVEFPEDPAAHGFDTVGSGLSVSSVHLEKYLAAARKIIDRALPLGPKPHVRKWHFEIDRAVDKPHYWLSNPDRTGRAIPYARLSTGDNRAQDDFLVIRDAAWNKLVDIREFKVHRPGKYVVTVRAAGTVPDRKQVIEVGMRHHLQRHKQAMASEKSSVTRNKMQEYWQQVIEARTRKHFENDPIYDYGPPRLRVVLNTSRALGAFEVTHSIDEPQLFTFSALIDKNDFNLRISNGYHIPSVSDNFFLLGHSDFPRPELLVDWIRVEGPVYDSWPPKSQQILLGNMATDLAEETRAKKALSRFMARAYRRPVRVSELKAMLDLFRLTRKTTKGFVPAIKIPFIAVLTSPNFLYLVEPKKDDTQPEPINSYELATRLSYFLWQTMPDTKLFELARKNELLKPEVYARQIDRLLSDPKSGSFTESFSIQWLGLRDADSVRPDKRLHPNFDEHLLESMLSESHLFFREFLNHDKAVFELIKSDSSMLNERLARFYGINNIRGDELRAVALAEKDHRGGVLTQASVHLATSNGTRTSPVKRGVWILENLMGSPPPPPPPNAGDIQPFVAGTKNATVRDRLEAHRENRACASCHAKIDPFGFALENYDAIGRWRDHEVFGKDGRASLDDPKIDNVGQLPNTSFFEKRGNGLLANRRDSVDGSKSVSATPQPTTLAAPLKFQGVHELQDLLLQHREVFLRAFVEKLLIFGLGRGIIDSDHASIERIIANAPKHGYTLRGLIKDIATSEAFRTK